MKKIIYKLSICSLIIMLFSCSDNDNIMGSNDFKGLYKIKSISSSLGIDLNNDGIKSDDYLQEIKSNYILFNGETINFMYNNELLPNFAEARPTIQQSNNAQLLDIRFPIQRIDSVYQGNNNYVKMNMEYRNMHTGFIYKLKNNDIEIESDPFNQFEFYNINNFEISRINKFEFQVVFDFKVYDFSENKWVKTTLKAKYEKENE